MCGCVQSLFEGIYKGSGWWGRGSAGLLLGVVCKGGRCWAVKWEGGVGGWRGWGVLPDWAAGRSVVFLEVYLGGTVYGVSADAFGWGGVFSFVRMLWGWFGHRCLRSIYDDHSAA